ncbi:MAG: LamG-like jellyroll fold domain-containing protein [Limisphaerales bacterium]
MKLLDSKKILRTALAAAALWSAGLTARADYSSEVLALQPLTYWRFNETNTFSFAATNLGTESTNSGLYSDPTYMQGQPGALAGSSDTSARFDGVMSKIDVPFDAALNPASFTVECWANVQGMAGNYRSPVTSRESTAGVLAGYVFYAGAGNTWEFWTGNGTGWNSLVTTAADGGSVVMGAWTHLVGTYDATNMTMSFYINGALVLQETNITYAPVGTVGSQQPLRVGAGATEGPGAYWFDGGVDEVAVYPTVLTPAQVAANYATGTTNGGAYAAQVLALQPTLYLRLDDKSANPPALNLGSLGAAANGRYLEGLEPSATDLTSPSFPGFASSNLGLVFNGTGQAVAFDYTNIPVPWTFTCWVNRQDAPGASAVLMYSSASGLKLEQYDNTLDVGFTAYGVADYTFNYSAPDGTWTQLTYVGTQDGTTLYVNGSPTDTNAGSISLPMTSLGVVNGDLLSGTVDEVATFNQALLDGQIMTLYLAAIGSNAPPALDNNVPILAPAGTVYATLPFSLSIDVYGLPPLSYEWLKGDAVVGTNAIYTVAAASDGSAGNYSVIVSNAYGVVTSAVLNVVVNPEVPAGIAQSPAPRSVYPAGTADFTVITSGTAPISYQWMKGGNDIPGATNQTLVITNAGPSDAASYSVGVSNTAGSAVSASAALTILIPTPGTYAQHIVTNGPLAYWRLNESSGTVAFDYAGSDDGTNSAAVTLGIPGPTLAYNKFSSILIINYLDQLHYRDNQLIHCTNYVLTVRDQ